MSTDLAIAATAARLVVEEGLEYAAAKRRALKELGLPARTPLPDNDLLEEAVRELKDEHFKELFADAQEGSSALARGSRRDQSDDCIIETDLTMLTPTAMSETAERLALYR